MAWKCPWPHVQKWIDLGYEPLPGRYVEIHYPSKPKIPFNFDSSSLWLEVASLKMVHDFPKGFFALRRPAGGAVCFYRGEAQESFKPWVDFILHGTKPKWCKAREE